MRDLAKTREDFTVLSKNKASAPIYFDSACMSLKPDSVVKAMEEYYFNFPACGNRGVYKMADKVTKKVKETRKIVAGFINAKTENEIIFTRNTTEGINLLANSFGFVKGDVVLISDKEHNSNLIPWLVLRDKIGIEVKICYSKEDNTFDLEKFSELVKGVKLVALGYSSNLDGVSIPAKEIIEIAHKNGALVFLDSAQIAVHKKIDVKDLDVDFLAFSGHKMLGPTGTGVFYGKYKLLENLAPFIVGGDTVEVSRYDSFELKQAPGKFEAGLQDFAGIIGLAEAVKYLENVGFDEIEKHEFKLNKYITDELSKFTQIKIIGPKDASLRSGIINFYIENTDMHKFATILDSMGGIAIRAGRHCVHSWFENKKLLNSARVSLCFYNTKEEAEIFITNLTKILKIIS
ncbi:MAG: cysteine desulfurase [Patescibacteria group bacterium]